MLQDYIYQIGLQLIEKKGEHWNFRCAICGDSKKNKYKKRGWILNKNGKLFYYCHNCDASFSFEFFLKKFHSHLYSAYKKENFINKKIKTITPDDIKPPRKKIIFPIKNLIKIIDLPQNHVCKEYIEKRKIPFKYHNILYYCENFQKKINELYPTKFEKYPEADNRLVIPFFHKNKIPYILGRTISDNYLRYITIKLLSDFSKIYGIERLDISKKIYVVEGPLDSLFLDNCIAMASASINFEDLLSISDKKNFVFSFDNENRNVQICKKIENVINNGFSVCMLPHEFQKFGKDINDYILSGINKDEIMQIINKNTFDGINAKIKLKFWKRC